MNNKYSANRLEMMNTALTEAFQEFENSVRCQAADLGMSQEC